MAAGDGVVLRAGRAGGYGNLIELRHRNGITTRYGHLRGFARGVRAGARVEQGQTIGYVGSTGLASGPHLHYEFRVNGVAKDSRRVELGNGAPVRDGHPRRLRAASATGCSLLLRPSVRRRRAALHRPAASPKPRPGGSRSAPVVDLFPAIDIRHGRVVRLSQGEATRQTVYGEDPVAVAERFADAGRGWIHVVDLDRAFGDGRQPARWCAASWPGSAGGCGCSSAAGSGRWSWSGEGWTGGDSRRCIGTAAAIDPAIVPEAVAAVGAERHRRRASTRATAGSRSAGGPRRPTSPPRPSRAAWSGEGVRTVVYTDVARDGMLSGPDLDGAAPAAGRGRRRHRERRRRRRWRHPRGARGGARRRDRRARALRRAVHAGRGARGRRAGAPR